ncbi:hypothetical protein E1181_07315 [Saccharopolyspora terrae]|uniref:Uncharacterized protein n=1 Tax=Saccharopolyspora terrae TaxID=2530384 RepID=A0A4R4VY27_9PSEU|nr:hypothetical protein [Saccharopolyspora terrae]TDD08353.1 hypothetical protein E1181_07315 [Saccharopolyspora terrae]
MTRARIRHVTKRMRDEVAQHNPMKPKNEASATDDAQQRRRLGRANSLLNTGPRVPPQWGPRKNR